MRLIILAFTTILISSFTSVGPKVKMKIVVVDENSMIIDGATVVIFKTFKDYEEEVNPVSSAMTSEKGYVQFKNLEERKYYILVRKGELNNNGGDNETDVLHAKGKNRFEIMID